MADTVLGFEDAVVNRETIILAIVNYCANK